ncbi:hypothetical protein Lbir_0611 [Legionella birminghamensis]|uniref:FlaG protein n=1 Tax=Legionella birminghamensis TaxID=28083 RepID=A0A378IAK3_9GAMM|nr:hypothetical protein [Legionella birminghamensis]KTC75237.1 hypothetical protein Lbir_0611 [Legionella birminghamensis]STX31812.1 Uncharacterised protein [Legionella birminghamensis]
MKIELNNIKSNSLEQESSGLHENNKNNSQVPSLTPLSSADSKQAVDKATGVLQTIVTEKLSEKVIRKMPPDEYLKLLSLVDEMISGSIDKKV